MTEEYIRTVRMEPNWSTMFEYCKQIVRSANINGEDLVIEMLDYGKRLHEQQKEENDG